MNIAVTVIGTTKRTSGWAILEAHVRIGTGSEEQSVLRGRPVGGERYPFCPRPTLVPADPPSTRGTADRTGPLVHFALIECGQEIQFGRGEA